MARPTKFTPDRIKRIIDALRGGCSRRDAYEYGGIDADTFFNWMKRFPSFSLQVVDAESQAAVFHTMNIMKAAKEGDVKASLEWLKRRRRNEWGDTLDIRRIDDETLLRLLAAEGGGSAERLINSAFPDDSDIKV